VDMARPMGVISGAAWEENSSVSWLIFMHWIGGKARICEPDLQNKAYHTRRKEDAWLGWC
jgi:hypothetical protein